MKNLTALVLFWIALIVAVCAFVASAAPAPGDPHPVALMGLSVLIGILALAKVKL